jgi:mannan endo-1,6-alpha-mannosidase
VDTGISDFFLDNIAYEEPCEGIERCTNSMKYYKGLLAQWYAAATEAAPQTAAKIMPVLKDSAAAAVKTCTGGNSDRACGFAWADGEFDGEDGASAQMSVLNSVSGLLVGSAKTETSKSGSKIWWQYAGCRCCTLFQLLSLSRRRCAHRCIHKASIERA